MKRKRLLVIGAIIIAIATLTNCSKMIPAMINPNNSTCGGVGLSNAQAIVFAQGNNQFFAIRTGATGLGPYFVSTSCGECHTSDNRGQPFTTLTRFGQADTLGNKFLSMGGPQLQNNNLPGFMPQQIPPGATSSRFVAPITAGVGFLEAVPDSEILAFAAANVNDPNGVRGHPNYSTIPSYAIPLVGAIPRGDGKYICRFGRKASTYNLEEQVANAYNHDMGITSTLMPNNPYNYLDQTLPATAPPPEVDNDNFNSVVFYVRCLQTPNQRNSTDATVTNGNNVFVTIGCETCHKQSVTTGYSAIASLAYQTISPFTDLLVHDMGPGDDDHYTEGSAQTSEWRTAPLWGLGLASNVQGGNGTVYLMHDGRARSVTQAIQMHGGEAAASVSNFNALSSSDKQALLAFLNSL